jgi:hypothetical protein
MQANAADVLKKRHGNARDAFGAFDAEHVELALDVTEDQISSRHFALLQLPIAFRRDDTNAFRVT